MTSVTSTPTYPKSGIALQVPSVVPGTPDPVADQIVTPGPTTERLQKTPLTLARVEIPQTLEPGQILLEVFAAAQNPVDSKLIDLDRITEFPWTTGGDAAGLVLAVGSDVKELKVGGRVASFLQRKNSRNAGYQQFAIATAAQTFKIPHDLSFEEASSIPLAFATAVGGVFGDLKVPIPSAGSKLPLPSNGLPAILVWGGSSSVGAYAIQLAKLSGHKVVATASPANFEYVKSLGADVVVDYHDAEKAVQEIKAATGGKLSLVVDAISENGSTELAAKSIGPDGGIINVVLPVDDSVLHGRKDVKILSAGARIVFERPEILDAYRFLVDALEQKVFVPNRIEVIPGGLLGVNEGFRRQRAHEISGVKLVYRVRDTPGIAE
ncbi:hypothetical protein RQP46_004395 [Phenoliferia psychrophenolica]